MPTVTLADIEAAAERLQSATNFTPVIRFQQVDDQARATIFFKCENFQRTGSFKFRGAYHAVSSLASETAGQPVVTVSSGNHGQALALAARLHGRAASVIAPGHMSDVKRRAILSYGARIIGASDRASAEQKAQACVKREHGILVDPFNDEKVIAGQGTCTFEFLHQVSALDVLLAPIGGGGLLSGACVAAHGLAPRIEIYACEPVGALDAIYSVREGRIVPMINPQTIADGLRSSLGTRTLEILRAHLAGFFTVEEAEIVTALRFGLEHLKLVMEPSSAVALAPVLRGEPLLSGKRVGIIVSGGNVAIETLQDLLA